MFCSFIVTVVFSKFLGDSNLLSLLTTVYSLSFIFTVIGFGSFTVTIIVYVFVLPFSAVTDTFILLSPSVTECSPVPEILAFESSLVAFTFIFSVFELASALYSVVFLLKVGDSFNPSIDKLFKLLFFEYEASSCA